MQGNALPVLRAGDLSETIRWYRETLGAEIADPVSADAPVLVKLGEARLILKAQPGLAPQTPAAGGWSAYWIARDVSGFYARIRERVRIVRPLARNSLGAPEFEFADCNGWVLAVGERVRSEETTVVRPKLRFWGSGEF